MHALLVFILAVTFMFASATLEIKKGWQLIGVPTTLEIEKSFNNKSVGIVWAHNALTDSWSGYSPNAAKSAVIGKKLTTLQPYQGMWIYSNEDWKLQYDQIDSTQNAKNDKLYLFEGWNLIAIPQQVVVSDKFFGNRLAWKYSDEKGWSDNDEQSDFPPIEVIKQSEGLWVKSNRPETIDIDKQSSELNTFATKEKMLKYIRTMIEMQNYRDAIALPVTDGIISDTTAPPAAPSSTSSAASASSAAATSETVKADDATTTNLQETGVDEGDILKHDGVHIFNVDNQNGKINITSFENIANKNYKPINTLDISDKYVVSLYLQNSRLTVISSTNYRSIQPIALAADTSFLASNAFIIEIFDISDINNIKSIATHAIEGSYQDSRVINGNLYLISQFSPNIRYGYEKVYVDTPCTQLDRNEIYVNCSGSSAVIEPLPVQMSASSTAFSSSAASSSSVTRVSTITSQLTAVASSTASAPPAISSCEYGKDYNTWRANNCYQYNYDEKGAWKYDYDKKYVISENLIPSIVSNSKTAVDLVSASSFYAPNKLNQRASITTVSRFTIADGAYHSSSSFLGNSHTYYASLKALYLVSDEYPLYYDYRHYKDQQMIYKFSLNDNLAYEGRGFVEGRMLNQFSMSEKDDYLRVATTSGWSWWNGGQTDNSVYTLKLVDKALTIEGSLKGLGKEGETIKAVRFQGDRGFVVTFRQTDPLYTIDLSNPKEPKTVGELSIPGFSSYLHVVDDNRVLSVGRNADSDGRTQELQFQLFDVSDFANPTLADKIQIGSRRTHSEAEYNHKAFTYRGSDFMFGVPYRDYSDVNKTYSENFGIYQINGLKIDSLTTLTSENSSWSDQPRGLIFDLNSTTYGTLFKGSNILSQSIK